MTKRAVLLIGFGGPTKLDEVRPFLDNVLRGRPVPPERYEEVVKQYEQIGGASPFNALAFELADKLKKQLAADGMDFPVYVGMRNWSPYLLETVERMVSDGVTDIIGIVLSSYVSEPSWDRYLQAMNEVFAKMGGRAPGINYASVWYKEPAFANAAADRIKAITGGWSDERKKSARWIFTAHSIPVPSDMRSRYSRQVEVASGNVAKLLGLASWSVAYQSRSGRPEDPWLEPDVGDAILNFAGQAEDVVVIPIGFLMDHVEVLFDLDVKARRVADEVGINFFRAGTVGSHPDFVRLLSGRVKRVADKEQAKLSL